MSNIIVIAQNEAARLANDSTTILCTIALIECIGIVIRGPLEFTLIHFDSTSNLEFIKQETRRLGPNTTIELFMWSGAQGGVCDKIVNFLLNSGITNINIKILDKRNELPYGILEAQANSAGEPDAGVVNTLLSKFEGYDPNINFGPTGIKIRNYRRSLYCFLNPKIKDNPRVVYENNEWQENNFLELGQDDLIILRYLLEAKNDENKLRDRIYKILTSKNSQYIHKFKEVGDLMSGKKNKKVNSIYFEQFPAFLKLVSNYAEKFGAAFSTIVNCSDIELGIMRIRKAKLIDGLHSFPVTGTSMRHKYN